MLILSHLTDNIPLSSQSFVVNVDATIETLLEREDTDGDGQITVDDTGPQVRDQPPFGSVRWLTIWMLGVKSRFGNIEWLS